MDDLLTLWERLDVIVSEVNLGECFAISDPFGHCVESETEYLIK